MTAEPALTPARQVAATGRRDLDVPCLSQLDNRLKPDGSCNVTCVAMRPYHLGDPRRAGTELEDEMYQKPENPDKRGHNPDVLQVLIGTHPGFKDISRPDGSLHDVQTPIDAGNPMIDHGYFTTSGQIIVIRSHDDKASS